MKKILIVTVCSFSIFYLKAQQNISLKNSSSVSGIYKKIANKDKKGFYKSVEKDSTGKIPDSVLIAGKSDDKVFGVLGAGNLNKEQLEKFNASGKFSCYVRPVMNNNSNLTFYLSFNKNATNNDSLLASTLIFPEVGNNSFLGTAEYALQYAHNDDYTKRHFLVPFLEFSNKIIKVSKDTAIGKPVNYHFSTLNYTLGCKYLFQYTKTINDIENNVYFSIAPYLSYLNIPNQDVADYRILLNSETLSDNLWSAGCKISVQYNLFSVFADFRHVLGSEIKVPVRELRGFNSNIGIVLNADLFGL